MAWNTDSNANRFIKSYVQDFIDVSGSLTLREKSNLNVNGSTTINGNLFLNNVSLLTDLSCNKRIFVGGDCSINGNLTSLGDISINGTVTSCLFKNSSIPQTAFAGSISTSGPDYSKPSVFYEQKFKADADISLNGNVVKVDRININGNVKLSDATLMNKYDNNIAPDLLNAHLSGVTFTKPNTYDTGFLTTIPSSYGKFIIMTTGGINYGYAQPAAANANNPINSWSNYTKFGLYITRDFGNTWTKYLVPYEDDTKLGYSYSGSAMSSDGKHIIIAVNPGGNNPDGSPSAVTVSHDYGYTWSSVRVPFYTAGSSGTQQHVKTCCISNDGRKMLASNGGEDANWFFSINYGLSWGKTATWGTSLMYQNGYPLNLFCNQDLTIAIIRLRGDSYTAFARIVLDDNMILIPGSYKETLFTSGSRLDVDGNAFPARSDASVQKVSCSTDFKTILFAHFGGNIITPQNTIKIELYDATTDRWRYGVITLTTTGYSSGTTNLVFGYGTNSAVVSRSGQFMYIIANYPNYTYGHFISSNYGATFTEIYPPPTTYTMVTAIFDDGSFLTMNGNNLSVCKQNIYKASIFTSLNITGNLVAGSFPTASDYRIKTDIAALDPTFTVDNLRPVKYLQTLINKTRYGVIAHELQLYYPDLVVGEKDGEELQNVNYTGLIAILINEIKRLKQEVLELENEV
jgi:hypothetical protein